MALSAVLFDIDGTLLDSNSLHCEAWRRAFEKSSYRIECDRIECEIGKGGDQLVPAILGALADARDGDAIRKIQSEEFHALAEKNGIKPFPNSLELIAALRQRKLKIAFATSSKSEQIETLQKCSGVDLRSLCDELASGDDVKKSKPAPDVVSIAVDKLGLSPAECVLVGDTSYDMHSAKLAGVLGIGVLSGFQSLTQLRRAGARRVWQDVAHIERELDDFLHCVSPAKVKWTTERIEGLMDEALALANEAMARGEAPIACVIADGTGEIFARGFNRFNETQSRIAHAEMLAFADAAGKRDANADDLILASTLEPCVMCLGAAMQSGIDTIVYSLRAPADSGTARVIPPQSPDASMPRIVGNVGATEARKLFKTFLDIVSDEKQRTFVEQLLARKSQSEDFK